MMPFFQLFSKAIKRAAISLLGAGLLCGGVVAQPIPSFYIRQYRVEGVKQLKNLEVEEAVYPFLGPGRSPDDVEQARTALERAYHAKGFQTVAVVIPEQDPRSGVIRLSIVESKVGRLRVTGANWYLPSRIMREVPSLAEGTVPNLTKASKEIVSLNRLASRKVTPVLRPGREMGTVDIDLNVEDKLPLHGSLELNNRYSANTTELRVNGSLSYENLFQRGHTGGLSFQVAPENPDDALVYSGYYLARVGDGVSLMLQGTKQNSDISTLGGAAVGGRGEILGLRSSWDLPVTPEFYQTLSLGADYKNFAEDLLIGTETISSPIEYYPLTANYSASWMREKWFTELNTSLMVNFRGTGSGALDYGNKRYGADGNFIILRTDASHTHDFSNGVQFFGKIQGQIASKPLVNSEQIAGGGLGSARGYLEATALGDNGLFATIELRSPSWIGSGGVAEASSDECRFHAFADVGWLGIHDALPGQQNRVDFASFGIGSRLRFREHFHGSVDVAIPLVEQPDADAGDVRVTFRGWADF